MNVQTLLGPLVAHGQVCRKVKRWQSANREGCNYRHLPHIFFCRSKSFRWRSTGRRPDAGFVLPLSLGHCRCFGGCSASFTARGSVVRAPGRHRCRVLQTISAPSILPHELWYSGRKQVLHGKTSFGTGEAKNLRGAQHVSLTHQPSSGDGMLHCFPSDHGIPHHGHSTWRWPPLPSYIVQVDLRASSKATALCRRSLTSVALGSLRQSLRRSISQLRFCRGRRVGLHSAVRASPAALWSSWADSLQMVDCGLQHNHWNLDARFPFQFSVRCFRIPCASQFQLTTIKTNSKKFTKSDSRPYSIEQVGHAACLLT